MHKVIGPAVTNIADTSMLLYNVLDVIFRLTTSGSTKPLQLYMERCRFLSHSILNNMKFYCACSQLKLHGYWIIPKEELPLSSLSYGKSLCRFHYV